MPFITIPASKKHKSLLEYDSDLDSNGSDKDDIQIKELSEEEEPDDDNGEDNEPEPAKILTPPPTTSKKRKRGKISPSDPPASVKEVTFITSITSAAEMKKPAYSTISIAKRCRQVMKATKVYLMHAVERSIVWDFSQLYGIFGT
ncbi:hypothetical protein BDR05DRAFT_949827 [Suillus weaverae]|nr:hypothetical protein BDR05DRAFT_949827 [Suillus weaverae]